MRSDFEPVKMERTRKRLSKELRKMQEDLEVFKEQEREVRRKHSLLGKALSFFRRIF